MTEWRTLARFPNYEVSDDGRVRRKTSGVNTRAGRELKQTWSGRRGYLVVHPSGASSQQVHALVLEAFVGPRPEGLQARHLDGNKANNAITNLRWGSALENGADRDRHGRTAKGERGGRAVLTEADVLEIRARYRRRRVTWKMLSEEFGVTTHCIAAILARKTWKHLWPFAVPEPRETSRWTLIRRQYAHVKRGR